MAKRLATVVVAVGLVVGAFFLRRNVIEGDEGDPSPPPAAEAVELVCVTELEAVCTEITSGDLRVTIEDAGTTLDRLAALPDGETAPLWLTITPYPEMVDSLRAGSGLAPLAGEAPVLAASGLTMAMPDGRLDVLGAHCGTTPLWRCVGDVAGGPWEELGGKAAWGRVEPSVGDADQSADALASLAVAVAGYLGAATYTSADWSAQPEFLPWVSGLVRAVPVAQLSGGTPARTMVTRPTAVNVAATSDAEIAALGASMDRFESRYPEPSMWLEAVLAAPSGVDVPDGLADAAAAALLAEGWDPPQAATQSLPSANTMLALRELWRDTQ